MNPPDEIFWARRVNSRWIVRKGLRESAAAYLDHLERTDPERLRQSCFLARRLVDRSGNCDDPKPWFYGGLFSLALPAELERYLADYHFIRACLPIQDETAPGALGPDNVGKTTWETILKIRAGVADATNGGEECP